MGTPHGDNYDDWKRATQLVTPSPEALALARLRGAVQRFCLGYRNADFSEPEEVRELDRAVAELREMVGDE